MHNKKSRKLTLLIIMLVALAPNVFVSDKTYAQEEMSITVSPSHIEVTLRPGECIQENLTVEIGDAPLPKLDVLLVVDVTGSMDEIIDNVTESMAEITTNIKALVPDVAFGLATFADYPDPPDLDTILDYPWRLDLPVTTDFTRLENSLQSITLVSGGDESEAYLRALDETTRITWRENSKRVVILFGDAIPHDPDPGKDEKLGTADDLTEESVLDALNAQNISVLSVYSNSASRSFYTTISSQTSGQSFELEDASQAGQSVWTLLQESVRNIQTLTLEPVDTDPQTIWEPGAYHLVATSSTKVFIVTLCAPEIYGGDITTSLLVLADSVTVATVPVAIQVISPTSTPTPKPSSTPTPTLTPTPTFTSTPVPIIPPLSSGQFNGWYLIPILFLLFLLLWLLRKLFARRSPPHQIERPPSIPDLPSPPAPPKMPSASPKSGADISKSPYKK